MEVRVSRSAEDRIAMALSYIASLDGYVCQVPAGAGRPSDPIDHLKFILTPPPKEHVFGGVRFVETGEVRKPVGGEWVVVDFSDGNSHAANATSIWGDKAYTIIKPVGLCDE